MLTQLDDDQCRALLQLLWDSSLTGKALVAKDGTFLEANPAFCRLTEYTESELRRRKFQDITDPEDIAADLEMAQMVLRGERSSYDMTKSYITKTKRLQAALLRVTALKTRGRFICFVSHVAPIERPEVQETESPSAKRDTFLKFLKEYWHIVLFTIGGFGYLLKLVLGPVSK